MEDRQCPAQRQPSLDLGEVLDHGTRREEEALGDLAAPPISQMVLSESVVEQMPSSPFCRQDQLGPVGRRVAGADRRMAKREGGT